MEKQLKINFKIGEHYFFSVDGKKDFIIYNANDYKLSNEPINNNDLVQLYYETPTTIINKLNSEAWSSNCKFYFVLQDEGIYLMNIHSNEVWLCRKHSQEFINMYLKNKKY